MSVRKQDRNRRRILLEKFGGMFRRYPSSKRCCIYCGMTVNITTDHVPPLDALDALGSEYFSDRGINLWLVNACQQCNSALGSLEWLHTITDRRKHIAKWLLKRYKRTLEGAAWSEDELEELGPGLRDFIRSRSDQHSIAIRRLRWATDSF